MTALGTRALRLFIDGTEFTSSVSNVRLVSAESDNDFVTFAQAAAGGARDYTLEMTLAQDTETTSLWYYAWAEAGVDQTCVIWPNGGTVESTTTPAIRGTVTVKEPDGDFLGGEANASTTARFTVDVAWPFTAKPTIDVTS